MSDALAEPLPSGAGDEGPIDSFEALYRRTFRRVYAYVASLLRDQSAAEEVTAQASCRRSTWPSGRSASSFR